MSIQATLPDISDYIVKDESLKYAIVSTKGFLSVLLYLVLFKAITLIVKSKSQSLLNYLMQATGPIGLEPVHRSMP